MPRPPAMPPDEKVQLVLAVLSWTDHGVAGRKEGRKAGREAGKPMSQNSPSATGGASSSPQDSAAWRPGRGSRNVSSNSSTRSTDSRQRWAKHSSNSRQGAPHWARGRSLDTPRGLTDCAGLSALRFCHIISVCSAPARPRRRLAASDSWSTAAQLGSGSPPITGNPVGDRAVAGYHRAAAAAVCRRAAVEVRPVVVDQAGTMPAPRRRRWGRPRRRGSLPGLTGGAAQVSCRRCWR
jgi:hypothetical protein